MMPTVQSLCSLELPPLGLQECSAASIVALAPAAGVKIPHHLLVYMGLVLRDDGNFTQLPDLDLFKIEKAAATHDMAAEYWQDLHLACQKLRDSQNPSGMDPCGAPRQQLQPYDQRKEPSKHALHQYC